MNVENIRQSFQAIDTDNFMNRRLAHQSYQSGSTASSSQSSVSQSPVGCLTYGVIHGWILMGSLPVLMGNPMKPSSSKGPQRVLYMMLQSHCSTLAWFISCVGYAQYKLPQ